MVEPVHGPGDWPSRGRSWLPVLLVPAVLFGGPWAARKVVGLDDGRSAEAMVVDVVHEFAQARRDGDCDRLVELVAESSWSAGGATRDEFVDRCDEAVAGYQTLEQSDESQLTEDLTERDVVVRRDRAAVDLSAEMDAGRLVREGPGWKIVLGSGMFRLGRTPYQTIDAYLDAYGLGDCDAQAELVAGGSEDERRQACEAELVEGVDGPALQRIATYDGEPDPVDAISEVDIDVAIAVAGGAAMSQSSEGFRERVHLVDDGFGWRIGGEHGPGDPLLVVDAARLATTRLLPVDGVPGMSGNGSPVIFDVVEAGFRDLTVSDDRVPDDFVGALRSDGFLDGAARAFTEGADDGLVVELRRFSSPEGADRSARRQVDLHLSDERYRQARRVTPVVDGADLVAGFVTESTWAGDGVADPDIEMFYLVAVRDGIVVSVAGGLDLDIPEVPGPDDDLDRAVAILQDQLDRL